MILRKPYAFLIKHFKLIHLIVTLLLIFIIGKTSSIINFFKDYVNDDVLKINASSYVNNVIYFVLSLIILLSIIIIILLRKKDKPILFYIVSIVLCIVLMFGFYYEGSIITELEFGLLDRKTINFARDIVKFMIFAEVTLLIPYVIRTLGFDIRKFDFKKDLQELNITLEDNEEFELLSPFNINKLGVKTRRNLRELKYYYFENKLFILIILGCILLFSGLILYNKIDFNSLKKYGENEIIKFDNLYTLKIDDSYITNKNDSGKIISVNNKFYLILKFVVTSNNKNDFNLDINNFIVKIKDDEFLPSKNYYTYFESYGLGYKGQKFSYGDTKTFILVYNIPGEYKEKNMLLEYNFMYNKGKMIKKKVKLSPEIVN